MIFSLWGNFIFKVGILIVKIVFIVLESGLGIKEIFGGVFKVINLWYWWKFVI